MAHSTNRYLQRAQRHNWEDGVTEIFIGIGAMLYAVFQAASEHISVPDNVNLRIVLTVIASMLVMFVGLVVFRGAVERVRARMTYPRTGFVELKRPPVEWTVRKVVLTPIIAIVAGVAGLALMLGLLLLFALVKVNGSMVLLSALLAASAGSMGWHTGLPRFYVLAGAILLVGIGLTATDTFGATGLNLLFGLTGLLVTLSGGIALMRFLHAHPQDGASS